MQESDIAEVMAIESVCAAHPWTPGIFRDCLRSGYQAWLLREANPGGAIIGYGILSSGAGEAHILNLCVRLDQQRQGWGKEILGHLLQLARRLGVETVFLEVRASNHAAFRLYQRAGFHQVGLRRDYYPKDKGREDALILALPL
jgi:ribosomal-protein-alanine N-acetyltransferase